MITFANPVHPGEVLKTAFMEEMNLTAENVAKAVLVPRSRVEQIVSQKQSMTADTAARLARYFGTSPEFWMNLQEGYDLTTAATPVDR